MMGSSAAVRSRTITGGAPADGAPATRKKLMAIVLLPKDIR
jgi:hypothetical protein